MVGWIKESGQEEGMMGRSLDPILPPRNKRKVKKKENQMDMDIDP